MRERRSCGERGGTEALIAFFGHEMRDYGLAEIDVGFGVNGVGRSIRIAAGKSVRP